MRFTCAAAALVVSDGISPEAATEKIRETLASGKAKKKLDDWRTAAQAKRAQTAS